MAASNSIPPHHFVGPAVVIDCSASAALNDDFELTPEIILAWEAEHGRIPADSWVLMRTIGRAGRAKPMPICARTAPTRPDRRQQLSAC